MKNKKSYILVMSSWQNFKVKLSSVCFSAITISAFVGGGVTLLMRKIQIN